MFAPLTNAAHHITGVPTASAISEDDSSESDRSTTREGQKQHIGERHIGDQDIGKHVLPNLPLKSHPIQSTERRSEHLTGPASGSQIALSSHPSSQQTFCASQQDPTRTVQSLCKDTLLPTVPKEHLVEGLLRTVEGVRQLRDSLSYEIKIQKELKKEHQALVQHIDHLGLLLETTAETQAGIRKLHNQSVIEVENMKAKVEQVSELATTYAIAAVKDVVQSLASGLDAIQERRRNVPRPNRLSNSPLRRRIPVRIAVDSTRNVVSGCQSGGKENETDQFQSPRSVESPRSNFAVSIGQGRVNQRSAVSTVPTTSGSENDFSTKRTDDGQFKASDTSHKNAERPGRVLAECMTQQPITQTDDRDDSVVERLPASPVQGTPGICDRKSKRIATILDVSVVVGTPPSSGSRWRFSVLATDSIVEVVNNVTRDYTLSSRKRRALIEYLEQQEEEAESFPVSVEVQLDDLPN